MGSRIGRFVIGTALVTASILVPGSTPFAVAASAALLSAGFNLAVGSMFQRSGTEGRQGAILANAPHTQAPLPVVYGTQVVGLRMVDVRIDNNSPDQKALWIVGALCHGSRDGLGIAGIDDIYFDSEPAWTAAGASVGRAEGASLWKFLGTYTQNVATNNGAPGESLNSRFPAQWSATQHRGVGVACIVMKLTYDQEKFAGGIPQITVKVRGMRCEDPRTGAWAFTTNLAVHIFDYLRASVYGEGAAAAEINTASFQAMANHYDELVAIPSGTQKRFQGNGWLDVSQPVKDNLRLLESGCRGRTMWRGGQFYLHTRGVQAPTTFAITEDHIRGEVAYGMPGTGDAPNVLVGSYVPFVAASNTYQPQEVQYPAPGAANSYLTDDNNLLVERRAELPFTDNELGAQQILNVALKEARAGTPVQLTCAEAALQLVPGDLVPVTYSSPGWAAKPFWVDNVELNRADRSVKLVLLPYDPNAYTLDAQTTPPAIPATNLPNPFTCAAPTGLVLQSTGATAIRNSDGTVQPAVKVTWVRPANEAYLDRYVIRAKKTTGGVFVVVATPLRDDLEARIPITDENWTIQILAVNTLGIPSASIQGTIIGGGADTVAPGLDACFLEDFDTPASTGRYLLGGATFSPPVASVTTFTTSVGNAQLNIDASEGDFTPFDGGVYRYVILYYRYTGPATNGEVYYQVPGRGYSTSFVKTFPIYNDGRMHAALIDMHVLDVGGTDWRDSTITAVQLRPVLVSGVAIEIDSIEFCAKRPSSPRVLTALDEDGQIVAGVSQDDGVQLRPLVKGRQSGRARDGDGITFTPVYQNIPSVRLENGVTYQGTAAKWTNPGLFSATAAQLPVFAVLNPSASGFTLSARLRQKGVIVARANPFVGTVLNVAGETDAATLANAPANDHQYTVAGTFTITLRSKTGGRVTGIVTVAIDTVVGGTPTERTTVSRSFSTTLTTDDTEVIPFSVTIAVSGLASPDQIQLRFVDFDVLGLYAGTPVGQVVGASAVGTGVTYNTSTDNFTSKTPDADDRVDWMAEGVQ